MAKEYRGKGARALGALLPKIAEPAVRRRGFSAVEIVTRWDEIVGSALAADTSAGMAMLVTHIAAATGSLVWMVIEWMKFGKPSLIGIITGMVAGLATITPASGFVGPLGGWCLVLQAG